MEQCFTIVPNFDRLLSLPEDFSLECLLLDGHKGPHLVKRSDGKYFVWEQDNECEGVLDPDSPCYEYCECFVFWEIAEAEALQMLANNK